MTIDAVQLAEDIEVWGDALANIVQAFDTEGGFGDTGPPELVALLGQCANVGRFTAMFMAQVCDALTGIAAQALTG